MRTPFHTLCAASFLTALVGAGLTFASDAHAMNHGAGLLALGISAALLAFAARAKNEMLSSRLVHSGDPYRAPLKRVRSSTSAPKYVRQERALNVIYGFFGISMIGLIAGVRLACVLLIDFS